MRLFRWIHKHVSGPVIETFTHFGQDDGYLLAAGVAYYVGLSFFPLLFVLINILRYFFQLSPAGPDAEDQVLEYIRLNVSPGAQKQAREVLTQFTQVEPAGVVGPIAIGVLLFAAGTIFAQFERAFDRIWKFTPPEDLGYLATLKSLLIERITGFILMIAVAVLIVATFVASTVLEFFYGLLNEMVAGHLVLPPFIHALLHPVATLALNTLGFGLLYHTMPRARVRWKEAFRGGIVVAVVWEIGRWILMNFLIGGPYSAMGTLSALIAIQLWAWYAVTVILLGAEYVRVTCAHIHDPNDTELHRRRIWQLIRRAIARKRQRSSPRQEPFERPESKPKRKR